MSVSDTLQNDKGQRRALKSLLDGSAPAMALKQDATLAPGALGPGSVERGVVEELRDLGTPATRFGTVGNGSTDDKSPLTAAFNSVASGGEIFLPPGDYFISGRISHAFTNARIRGIPGKTKIFTAADNCVLRLLACTNVEFYGIEFTTTRVNAGEDTSAGVVYMNADGAGQSHNLLDVRFVRCKFSAPNCNTNGFKAALSSGSMADVDCSNIDGLVFEDCDFVDIGRMGIELVNNKVGTSKTYRRVKVIRQRCKNIGVSGSNGMGVSFSGPGYHNLVEDGEYDNCYKLSIENAGSNYCTVRNNRFVNQPNGSGSFGTSSANYAMVGNVVSGNRDETPAPAQSYILNTKYGFCDGNTWRGSSATQPAMLFRDVSRTKCVGDTYVGYKYGISLDSVAGSAEDNHWLGCTFDCSEGVSNAICAYFTGATVARNTIEASLLIRSSAGEWLTQANSAQDNRLIRSPYANSTAGAVVQGFGRVSIAITGNQTALERDMQSPYIELTGTPASSFTLTIPKVHRMLTFNNNTGQSATISFGSGTTASIANGERALISVNTTVANTGCTKVMTTTS